ncbi:MAG: hypothetical protein HGA21_03900 [Burkholderiaceae bacterium]|nr:hypothetical protein [Burkholderiaceae bacterium]
MPTALELASGHAGLTAAVRRGRKILHRRALVAAAAGAMPVPGLDWAVDAALLSRIIPKINAEFGLMPDQLDRLTPHERERVQKAVALVGTVLIGKFITRDLVIKAAKMVGLRLTAGQAARYVPMAGQLLSAMVGYSAIRYIGEEHMKDCVRVALKAELRLPYQPIGKDVEQPD